MLSSLCLRTVLQATREIAIDLLRSRWSILLGFTAVALAAFTKGAPEEPLWAGIAFLICGFGLIPLAKILADLVDLLSEKLGDRLGGLVNVAFGNLVEIVVSITALTSGLFHLVVISLAGSVITNSLLMLGLSVIVAGRKTREVKISSIGSSLQARQLTLGVIFVSVPSIFAISQKIELAEGGKILDKFGTYSIIVSLVVLCFYLLSFLFSLGTHRELFEEPLDQQEIAAEEDLEKVERPIIPILILLVLVSVLLAGISEPLVDSLQNLVSKSGLSDLFVGLFLLPLFGSISEGMVAVRAASEQRMGLAMTSTLDSATQLLMFVLPLLVLIGWALGSYLHLSLPIAPLGCLIATAVVISKIVDDRQLDWYEGVALISLYLVLMMGSLLITT